MNWTFTPPKFDLPAPGNYLATISGVVEKFTRAKGLPMLEISLALNNNNFSLKHYLVFDNSSPRSVNRSNFYYQKFADAFSLTLGDFNIQSWINHVGGIVIIHEMNAGKTFPKIKSFFTPNNSSANSQGFNPQPYNPDNLFNFDK